MGSNIDIWQSEGGAYMRDKNTYAGTWAKSVGGLIVEGGVIAGFYGNSD